MLIVSGECPNCLTWIDKIIRQAYPIAPVAFIAYCEKCGKEVKVETMQISKSLDGSYFTNVPPRDFNFMR